MLNGSIYERELVSILSGVFAIFQPALFFVVPAGGSIVEFFIFMKYVPIIPEIAELNPKYSPLLSAGAILEIVTEKKGLVRLSPSVRRTTFSARSIMLPVRPKTINDMT